VGAGCWDNLPVLLKLSGSDNIEINVKLLLLKKPFNEQREKWKIELRRG